VARILLVFSLLALIAPSAASARKNAWQLVALSGTYAYHATSTAPPTCAPDNGGQGGVLSRDYTVSFHADSFPTYQYAAKYFPALEGPQTNGPGQKAHLVGETTSSETYRTFDSSCAPQDQHCSKLQPLRTARFMFSVTTKNFRPGGPLQTVWNLNFSPTDCTPRSDDFLQNALVPLDSIPSEFKANTSRGKFTRKRATFTIHGSATVPKTSGYNATVTYSARATLKKVLIADGCVDRHPQHAFVCTN
jgi:hypothetical protein